MFAAGPHNRLSFGKAAQREVGRQGIPTRTLRKSEAPQRRRSPKGKPVPNASWSAALLRGFQFAGSFARAGGRPADHADGRRSFWRSLRPWCEAYGREVNLAQRARRHKDRDTIPRPHNCATQTRTADLLTLHLPTFPPCYLPTFLLSHLPPFSGPFGNLVGLGGSRATSLVGGLPESHPARLDRACPLGLGRVGLRVHSRQGSR